MNYQRIIFSAAFAGAVAFSSLVQAGGSIGGDCCADLEERVAELEATSVRKGNRKVSLTLYGHVNQGILIWDDGHEDDAYIVGQTASQTRFGLKGGAKVNSDLKVGYKIEIGINDSRSGSVDQDTTDVTGLKLRKSYLYFKSKSLGKVTVGLEDQATDGITRVDLASAGVFASGKTQHWNSSFKIKTSTGADSGLTWGGTIVNTEGDTINIVRYDSPSIAGFKVSASWSSEEQVDVALRFAQQFGDFKFAAGVGYLDFGDAEDADQWGASASLMHTPTGLNVMYGTGEKDEVSKTESFWYVKGGIANKFISAGKTNIFAEYRESEDKASIGGESTSWGIGVVQKIDSAATELYLGYRNYSYDDASPTEYSDFDAVMTGARIKF